MPPFLSALTLVRLLGPILSPQSHLTSSHHLPGQCWIRTFANAYLYLRSRKTVRANPSHKHFRTTSPLAPGWPHISFPTILKTATLKNTWFCLSFQSHMVPKSPCYSFPGLLLSAQAVKCRVPERRNVCSVWQHSMYSSESDRIICLLFSPTSEEVNFVNFSDKAQRLLFALSLKLRKKKNTTLIPLRGEVSFEVSVALCRRSGDGGSCCWSLTWYGKVLVEVLVIPGKYKSILLPKYTECSIFHSHSD